MHRARILSLLLCLFATSCGYSSGGTKGKVAEQEPVKEDTPPPAFSATSDLEAYLRYESGNSWETRDWEVTRLAKEEEERKAAEEAALIAQMEVEAEAEKNSTQ